MQYMGLDCREATGYLKVLNDIQDLLQTNVSTTWETLCMSQGQDVSQVLSKLTRPEVYQQSRHNPTFT